MSSLWRPGLADTIGHIYILQSVQFEELYKIGRSGFGKLDERFRALRVGHELRHIFDGVFFDYCRWEKALHRNYKTRRLPQSEYFRLSATEVKYLRHQLFFPHIETKSRLEGSQVTMQTTGGFLRLIDSNSLDEVCIRHCDLEVIKSMICELEAKAEILPDNWLRPPDKLFSQVHMAQAPPAGG